MNNRDFVALIIIALFLAVPLQAQTRNVAFTSDRGAVAAAERLRSTLPPIMNQADVPGLSVALIRDGKLAWNGGFGVRNSQTKEPVTEDTVFEAASLTKPVFAYAVLKLVDAGKLDLDKPLNTYLPGSYDVDPADKRLDRITARQVLSHTTGFPNWRSPRNSKTLPIFHVPGERFSYSGEGFVYLSKVVEQVTGMKFDEYVRRSIFVPLGMNSSSLAWQDKYRILKTFNHDTLGNPTGQAEGVSANAAGSLHTTTADYAKFVMAMLKGDGLKKSTHKQMLSPQSRPEEGCRVCVNRPATKPAAEVAWGLGWGLQLTPEGNSFWHWGDNGNNKAFIVASEKSKDGLIVLTNGANGLMLLREILGDGLGGRHPAVDWINPDRFDSPARVLLKSMVNEGQEAALKNYRVRREKSPSDRLNEAQINSLGYDLLRMKKLDAAVALFTLNTEDFPQSANTWDSLAEGYMVKGDKPKAIEYYRKSLSLDPNNKNAADRIKQLEQ